MGWSEQREVDPAPFLASLAADGYVRLPQAKRFFQRFGGLAGDMPAYRVAGALDRIDFDPARTIACTCRETVRSYEARVQGNTGRYRDGVQRPHGSSVIRVRPRLWRLRHLIRRLIAQHEALVSKLNLIEAFRDRVFD